MAYLAGSGNGTPPGVSATASASTSSGINSEQLNLAQLMALMQQQQQQSANPAPAQPSIPGVGVNQASLYQQLLLQSQLQQQVPQATAPTPSGLNLAQLQQLAATLNQPSAPALPTLNPALLQMANQQSQLSTLLAALQQQQIQQQQNQMNPTTALLNTLLNTLQGQANLQQLAPALNLLAGQTAAAPQAATPFGNALPTQTDESKALLEYYLRQQQQQQELAAMMAAASVNQTPRSSLSTQNSSSSLIGQPGHIQNHGSRTSGEAVYVSIPPSTSSTPGAPHSSNFMPTESGSTGPPPATTRQASSDRLLTSAQSVEDHITRLISENAAIVEPNPVLLKRRPYNRQNTSSSITSNTGNNDQNGSNQGSPGLGSPGQTPVSRIPTTRSQSLHEPAMLSTLRMANGSLTSGQPIIRGDRILTCLACGVKFPNETALEAHQIRCGKKDMLLKQHSQPQLSLHTHASTAFQTPQQLLLQQQKSQAEHEARISALIGGGAGVPSDFTLQTNTGRSSVPVGAGTSGSVLSSPPLTQQILGGPGPGSRKGSMQSPFPNERQQSKKRLFDKSEDYIDVVTVNESQPESPGSNAGSTNASKPEPMDTETAPTKMAKIPFCEPSTSACASSSSVIPTSAFHVPSSTVPTTAIVNPVYELPPESKATQEMVQLQLAFYERRLEPMPYVVTYVNQNDMPPIVDNDVNAAVNRRMLKTLTNCSKVCDTMPHCRVLQTGESHFSLYKQAMVLDEQVQQLFQYLGCYSTKPRTNVKRHCIYTIADKTSGAHPNHSRAVPTFIAHSQQPTNTFRIPCPTLVIPSQKQSLPDPVMLTSAPASSQYLPKPNPIKQIKPEAVRYANDTDELESNKQSFPGAEYAAVAAKIKPISGGRSEEVEVYVRGRGRGRYVCDRCGIKCKKPSMLKKHLKSHTNIRPFICITCNFGFKTKGNLTKHLFSKAHRRKLEEQGHEQAQSPGLAIVDEDDDEKPSKSEDDAKIEKRILLESQFLQDNNDDEEMDEENLAPIVEAITYRRFGQENIIYERETHTPPTLWTLCTENDRRTWPQPDLDRSCHSAPPVFEFEKDKKRKKSSTLVVTAATSTQALPQTEPNIGCIVIQQMMKDGSKFAESVSKGDQEAQMQFTNEVVRMSRAVGGSGYMLPVVKCQEVLEPVSRKRPYPTNSNLENVRQAPFSSFISSDSFNCDQCDKKYRKESELNLHKKTHLIEKQIKTSRAAKSCQCPECKTLMRSKAVLAKHMETVHPGVKWKLVPNATSPGPTPHVNGLSLNGQIGISPSSSSTASLTKPILPVTPATGRSFICTDCNLGFRTHGVLAKHLRAKNHVKALVAAGKLPEDSLTIIRDNSLVLATVDATDCEAARISLLDIIEKCRKSNGSSIPLIPVPSSLKANSSTNSLECTEELSSISPTPRLPEQNFRLRGSSPVLKNVPPNLPKRSADESASPIAAKRRQLNISPETRQTFSGNGLLGASQMNFAHQNQQHRYSISDIWVPPKAEDLENSGIKSVNVLPVVERPTTTDGNLSDATSRSETSTPQQKPAINLGISLGVKLTRCQLCDDEFENPCDLQVHFQSEHICMRDGSYFQCPNSSCEKVYPSKDALRNHLFAHYRSGTFVESPVGERDDEFAPATNQSAVSPEDILSNGGVASPAGISGRKDSKTAHTAPKHSPGAPEESHTLTGIKVEPQTAENFNSKNRVEKQILKCNQCQLVFTNADEFQKHCVVHSNRPHICEKCDAGFTSAEALKVHAIGHS